MSIALSEPDRTFTREEYRVWYDAQPSGRYERVDGRIVKMAAERIGHVRVKAAVWLALQRAIAAAGVACEALPDGATVETGNSDYEPDALVHCGARLADDAIVAPNPIVVVEVLSPGTRAVDTGGKLIDYFRIPSLEHYLIVHPGHRSVIHHHRAADGIMSRIITQGLIAMNPPGITITLDEIYA